MRALATFHKIPSHIIQIFSHRTIVILYFLVLGVICYIPSISGSLFWDDEDFIVNNTYVQETQLYKFFTHQAVEGSGKPSNYFRPLQFSLYALTYLLYADNPLPYHTVSIVIHIAASIAVYLFMYELLLKYSFSNKWKQQISTITSLSVSTIFLLHPVQTEAVSYVSGMSDPLVALFGFITLWMYLKTPKKTLPLVAVLFYTLTLLSKESGIIFSGIIFFLWVLLTIHTRKKEKNFKQILYSFGLSVIPFFIISCVYLLYHTRVIQVLDMTRIWGDHPYTHSVLLRLVTFLSFIPEYIKISLFPLTLYYDRDFSVTIPDSLWHLPSLLVLGIIITICVTLLLLTRRSKSWSISLFFFVSFFISFLPFSGIILINGLMYEHFLYVPIVFFSGWIVTTILLATKTQYISSVVTGICIVSIAIIPVFIARSWQRQYEWIDPIRLYLQTLHYVPNSFRVRNNLATEYQRIGEIEKAKEEYLKVIQLSPHIPNPYHNLGNLLLEQKQYDEAETYFLNALEVDSSFGYSYSALIRLYTETGEHNKLETIKEKIKNL